MYMFVYSCRNQHELSVHVCHLPGFSANTSPISGTFYFIITLTHLPSIRLWTSTWLMRERQNWKLEVLCNSPIR